MKAYKRFLLASAAVLALGGQDALAAQKIGTAAAVKNRATGTIGGETRTLKSGLGVFKNERVDTSGNSTAQLIFSDETALTIGPNSSVTLDEFVYDPDKNTGKTVINATKGAFRFISGSSNPRSYKIKTPVGTMGVRGTIVDFFFLPNGALVIILVEGAFSFTNNAGQTTTVNTAGNFIVINPDGSIGGPHSWTGNLNGVIGNISFPLFGWQWQGNQNPQFGGTYNPQDINSALNGAAPNIINRPSGGMTQIDPPSLE